MRLPQAPFEIRYIKLGLGGAYADGAIARGDIPLNFPQAGHAACLRGDWQEVERQLLSEGRSERAALQDLRELRDYYELPAGSLWISFSQGHLWWCLAGDEITELDRGGGDGPTRARATQNGWHNASIRGTALTTDSLSSSLTKTGAYKRTICTVRSADYLLRKIRDEDNPLIKEMHQHKAALTKTLHAMIKELHEKDLETLVDLIFARQGWQRTSRLGGDMPDIDLALEQPLTGARAYVQVKADASHAVLRDYTARLSKLDAHADVYFVCAHGLRGDASAAEAGPSITVWLGPEIAHQALSAGLINWVAGRMR